MAFVLSKVRFINSIIPVYFIAETAVREVHEETGVQAGKYLMMRAK